MTILFAFIWYDSLANIVCLATESSLHTVCTYLGLEIISTIVYTVINISIRLLETEMFNYCKL